MSKTRTLFPPSPTSSQESLALRAIYRELKPTEVEDFEPSTYSLFQERFWSDPVGFVHHCINWSEGNGSEEYQDDVLSRLVEYKRECVRSLHGAGKTATAAWAILWFALTRDGRDWKIVTTASVGRQLYKYSYRRIYS